MCELRFWLASRCRCRCRATTFLPSSHSVYVSHHALVAPLGFAIPLRLLMAGLFVCLQINKKVMGMIEKAETEYKELVHKKKVVENDKKKIEDVIDELDQKKNQTLQVCMYLCVYVCVVSMASSNLNFSSCFTLAVRLVQQCCTSNMEPFFLVLNRPRPLVAQNTLEMSRFVSPTCWFCMVSDTDATAAK